MLIRVDVLMFAMLSLPLVAAGMASAGTYYHPPKTPTGTIAVLLVIGLPLYFAGIIAHFKIFKEQGRDRAGYSRGFALVVIVAAYALGLVFGAMIFG